VITTLVGKDISFAEFRAAVARSAIAPLAKKFDSKTRYLPADCSDRFCPKLPMVAPVLAP